MRKTNFGLNLKELSVTNFATFSNQKVKFDEGFNAIIGETGSGKSLILEALQLILGQRADKRIIRKDSDCAVVEATFTCLCPRIRNYLDELGYPFEGEEVVIKRLIYRSGKTKSFLNLQTCSLSTIINFTSNFVDLVGQFENQKLLSSKYQLQLLDDYAGIENLLEQYKQCYSQLIQTRKELAETRLRSQSIAERADYLDYQIEELNRLSPSVEDEEELSNKKRDIQKLESRKERMNFINNLFEGSETGDQEGLNSLIRKLEREVLHLDTLSNEELSEFQNACSVIIESSFKLNSSYNDDVDETELEGILDRLDSYQKLKRKFKVETAGLQDLLDSFIQERQESENLENMIDLYEERIRSLSAEAFSLANDLHSKRVKASKSLSNDLTECIQSLNMKGASIVFKIERTESLGAKGCSEVQLIAETNPGEGFFLLKDIASGGELSRILLSIRNVLASKDSISIFLFDEIDSGIGGETALTIGKTLAEIAKSSQVIAITHLPQIANNANKLVIVSKELIEEADDTRTISMIKEVAGLDIQKEVELMTPLN